MRPTNAAGFAQNWRSSIPDGAFTTFAPAGSTNTYALSIDDQGRIAGSFLKNGTTVLGFKRRNNGTIGIVMVPGSLYTNPESISSAGGLITGSWNDDKPGSHGFLRSR